MQYHAIPCNTMQYHACLITVDGAYHCPVGSIWLFFPSGNDYTNHTILLYSAPPRRDHILYRTSQHFSNVSMYSMSLKLPLSASKESISLFSPYLQAVTQLSFCLLDLKDLKAAPLHMSLLLLFSPHICTIHLPCWKKKFCNTRKNILGHAFKCLMKFCDLCDTLLHRS